MGVNKLLRAGIENERNQLTKEEEKSTQEVAIRPLKDDAKKTTTTKKDSNKKATGRKVEEKVQQKNKGGRQTNKKRG